jgi:hypothetical protein
MTMARKCHREAYRSNPAMTARALCPWFSALALLVSTTAAWSDNLDDTPAPEEIDAIWDVQQLRFNFRSFRTHYACEALERKIANILRAVGARADVAVRIACDDRQFLNHGVVNVTAAIPLYASDENIRRATTFDARERLIARVRNVPLPTAAYTESFPARWQRMSLARHRLVKLGAGDCDLLLAMNKQLFPKMSVALNRRSLNCSTSATRLRPRFEVTALVPLPHTPLAHSSR